MVAPDITLPGFLANPTDDILLFLIGLTLRFFIKPEKPIVKIFVYMIPLILKYAKRYYQTGHAREKIEHIESETALLKQSLKSHRKIG